MNKEEILGAFSLVNNPIVLSEEETKDVQKAIKQLQQENKQLKEVIEEVREYILNHELVEEKDHYVLNGKELLQILDKAKCSED